MSAMPLKAGVNSGHQRYRALEIIRGDFGGTSDRLHGCQVPRRQIESEPGDERKEAPISDRGRDRPRYRALEIIAGTLEGRAIDFMGARCRERNGGSFPQDQIRSWRLPGVKRTCSALVVTSDSDPPLKLATSTHPQSAAGSRSCRCQTQRWSSRSREHPGIFRFRRCIG